MSWGSLSAVEADLMKYDITRAFIRFNDAIKMSWCESQQAVHIVVFADRAEVTFPDSPQRHFVINKNRICFPVLTRERR